MTAGAPDAAPAAPRRGVVLRALGVWLVLMAAETVHGILRVAFVEPHLGGPAARRLAVLTGSVLLFLVTWLLVPRIGARSTRALLGVGLLWLVLTLAFEVLLGRFAAGLSWERIASDYDPARGGLLPLGLLVLTLSPWLACRLRERRARGTS